jgi:DNA mismatch repair protein MutS
LKVSTSILPNSSNFSFLVGCIFVFLGKIKVLIYNLKFRILNLNIHTLKNGKKETPLMTQYNTIKAKYPDALLLFRVGDFYETFGQDAIKTSQILGIVLTKRANGEGHIELAGFPHHSVDSYLPKLVRAGMRVAICDQLEDPKMVKGIVKRGVTELVTPVLRLTNRF